MDARRGRSAAAVLVALLAALLVGAPALAQERPELEGLALEEAIALLREQDLQVELEPAELPGEVDRSLVVVVRQVALTDVDGGAPYGWRLHLGAPVPDVVGRSLVTALEDLTAAGLAAKVRRPQDPDDLLVVTQSPAPGTVLLLGEAVGLTVAPGVRVPDVVGLSLQEATDAVQARGLTLTASGGGDSPGAVLAQDPPGGTLVPGGARVSVRLDVLPPRPVLVPDLTGARVEEARERLLAVGLVLEATIQGDEGEARVVTQNPPGGTLVQPASVVLARFEAPVVPVAGGGPADDGRLPWALVAAATAAAAAAASLLGRALRRSRERTWIRQHVACRGQAGSAVPPRVDRPDDDVCWAVRIDVHRDPGRQELEEARS